jgi:hypothetical protein
VTTARPASALGLVLVAVALLAGLVLWVGPLGQDAGVTLLEVRGDVSISGPDARARPAEVGVGLAVRERLTTADGARAVLAVGEDGRLDVAGGTALEIVDVDEDGVSVELFDGRVTARVRPTSPVVRVGSRGRTVVATDGAVDVAVLDGVLYAETVDGAARVEGVGDERALAAGQRLVASDDAEIGPIPVEFLLAVEWPGGRTAAPTQRVAGRSAPGARVRVRGPGGEVDVAAGPDGAFAADVPLVEGDNPLTVLAEDPLGHSGSADGAVRRDSRGPQFEGAVEYPR